MCSLVYPHGHTCLGSSPQAFWFATPPLLTSCCWSVTLNISPQERHTQQTFLHLSSAYICRSQNYSEVREATLTVPPIARTQPPCLLFFFNGLKLVGGHDYTPQFLISVSLHTGMQGPG